jgi:hypothetical protein
VLSRPVKITVRALADMLRIQGIGALPVAIQPEPVVFDPDSDRDAAEGAWQDFRDVGLVNRRGRLDGEALDTLHVLARPGIEYTAIVVGSGYHDEIIVAAHGSETVIARRVDHAVTLASVRNASLPETLLREIPDAHPARIGAINVRIDGSAEPTARDARTLAYLTGHHPTGHGELSVAVRDPYGRRRRSTPIRYQDFPIGRVVVVIGGGYLSVAPATKVLLRDRLHSAHQKLLAPE